AYTYCDRDEPGHYQSIFIHFLFERIGMTQNSGTAQGSIALSNETQKGQSETAAGSSPPAKPSVEEQFRLLEFTELSNEIQSCTDETRKLENFCLIGAAAIFSGTATQPAASTAQSHGYVAALVPPLLVLFGWIKCYAIESNIKEIGKYISSLERKILP